MVIRQRKAAMNAVVVVAIAVAVVAGNERSAVKVL
jgi:hypothetical protein